MQVIKLPTHPDCEATTGMRFEDRSNTGKCLHSSRYKIDGKYYCAKHAQIAALEYYLKATKDAQS